MTISSTEVNTVREDFNGVKTVFDFSFTIFEAEDVVCYEVEKATNVATLLTQGLDYSVTTINTDGKGGQVTYTDARSSSYESLITREVEYSQPLDLPRADGVFPEESLEVALDRVTVLVQQILSQFNLVLKQGITATQAITAPDGTAQGYWYLNGDGTVSVVDTNTDITTYNGVITAGADASKSASPAKNDIYIATDTGFIYLCLVAGAWSRENRSFLLLTDTPSSYTAKANHLPVVNSTPDALEFRSFAEYLDDLGITISSKGLTMRPNAVAPNNKLDITASFSVVGDYIASSVSVSVDITASGANGLDTGSEANSTWYFIYLIHNGTAVAGLLSTSASAPTMPSGYTSKRIIGAVYNDSSGNFRQFYQKNSHVQYATFPTVTSATNSDADALVPSISREGYFELYATGSTAQSGAVSIRPKGSTGSYFYTEQGYGDAVTSYARCITDADGKVEVVIVAAGTVNVKTVGYEITEIIP